MQIYKTKTHKFAGTDFHEVKKKAFGLYTEIKRKSKRGQSLVEMFAGLMIAIPILLLVLDGVGIACGFPGMVTATIVGGALGYEAENKFHIDHPRYSRK